MVKVKEKSMPVKSLTDIKPNKANPRRIKKDRQEKLSEYLTEYGDLSGVVYNANPECEAIVSGHQRTAEFKRQKGKLTILERYEPAQGDGTTARGFIETPNGQRYLYREVNWPKEKAEAATIIANGQFGEWDSDILANEWDFDVPEFREFGVPEFVFGGDGMDGEGGIPNNSLNSEAKEDDFEAPAIEEVVTDIKPGDLFEIGPHRLLCGDSTKKGDVEHLMGGEKADMVFTDPPYNCASDSRNFASDVSKAMANLKNSEWDKSFNIEAGLSNLLAFVKKDFTAYVWTSHFLLQRVVDFFKPCDYTSYLDWAKPNPMPSLSKRHPTWNTELCVYASSGSNRIVNFPSDGHFLSCRVVPKNSDGTHPTQKPVPLCAPIIKFSSNEGNVILDLFLGSGTTMVAAHQLNRRCYGMEIDPKYCQVIVNRMMKLDPSLEIKRNGEPYNPK